MPSCPLPSEPSERIVRAHGGGGRWTHRLLDELIYPELSDVLQPSHHDGASLPVEGRCVLTTDSYVVQPIFFAGGDIGALAICGTLNDLAMCGARPVALSLALILEEGLLLDELRRVLRSIAAVARELGVVIVTGDTKVVAHPHSQGMMINTTGVGRCETPVEIHPRAICPGDRVLLSGDVGRHGMAVMAAREGLRLGGDLHSDVAPLWPQVEALLQGGVTPRCLRDLTRGGLATALYELAQACGSQILLREAAVECCDAVRGACELLGLDPLYCANEGRFVAVVPPEQVDRSLELLQQSAPGLRPRCVGEVLEAPARPPLLLENAFGVQRILRLQSGELLPRIC